MNTHSSRQPRNDTWTARAVRRARRDHRDGRDRTDRLRVFQHPACGQPTDEQQPRQRGHAGTTRRPRPRAPTSHRSRPAKGNATALLVKWASCMNTHGDPNQAAPTIDANERDPPDLE